MLVVISPAKKLDWDVETPAGATLPRFQADAVALADVARGLDVAALRKLMGLSEALATLNRDRFAEFSDDAETDSARPAALAFAGDTYTGLEARTLEPDDLAYAQRHLRILSGLYGVLRPLDQMQAYRLEMGSRLKTERGKSLYDYWGSQLSEALNADAEEVGSTLLLNCASTEYFGAVDLEALKLKVITPTFLEDRDGEAKIVSFFAKKARGAMARFVMENRITDEVDLAGFTTGGYALDADRSSPGAPVFVRDYPETKKQPARLAS